MAYINGKDVFIAVNAQASGGGSVVTRLQDKNIVPSNTTQYIIADSGYDALRSVTVQGDANLKISNIKKGVSIFGVFGTYEGEAQAAQIPSITASIGTDQSTGEMWIDGVNNVDYMVIYVDGSQRVARNVTELSVDLKSILDDLGLSTGSHSVTVVLYASGYYSKTLNATYTVNASGGGSGESGDTYYFDDADGENGTWYERTAGAEYTYKGVCPSCRTELYTNYTGRFDTNCPSCNESITYYLGDVNTNIGGGDTGGDDTGERIYATYQVEHGDGVYVDEPINNINTIQIVSTVSLDVGKTYYLEGDGVLIGYSTVTEGDDDPDINCNVWSVGGVDVVKSGIISGHDQYTTISIYTIGD